MVPQLRYKKIKRINTILSWLVYCLTLIAICTPYVPEFTYQVQHLFRNDSVYERNTAPLTYTSGPNRLSIPSIGVEQEIMEAVSIEEIHEKVWRRPNTSMPDIGGNTVLVAHRYASIGGYRSSTFYHLPKILPGDKIYVTWDKVKYTYEVLDTQVVDPQDLWVEEPTDASILTLYTCTPLWTSDKRFVVRAKLLP